MKRACLFPLLLALVACDTETPPEVAMPKPAAELTPDPDYSLNASQRASLLPAFDPDAIEALLALYPDPQQREEALAEFLSLADLVARGEIQVTDVRFLGAGESENQGSDQVQRAIRTLADRSPFSRAQRPQTSNPD